MIRALLPLGRTTPRSRLAFALAIAPGLVALLPGTAAAEDATPREQDAHADRVVLAPTAFVHPAGTVYASTYDLFIYQVGYALTDTAEVTVTASLPIEDTIVPVDLSLKVGLLEQGPVRVAALGSASGIWGLDQGNFVVGRAGAVAQLCLDDACQTSASAGADVALAGADSIVLTGAGVIWRVAPGLSFLAEGDTVVPLGRDAGKANAITGWAGVRLPHRSWALDLTLGKAAGIRPALPLLVFTCRFLP
jgi:hypothetical protein